MKTPIVVAVALVLTSSNGHARLGETLEQCTARYGANVSTYSDANGIGERAVVYKKNGYLIEVDIFNGKAAREVIGKLNGDALSDNELKTLLNSESSSGNSWLEHDSKDAPRRIWVRGDNAHAVFNGSLLQLETHDYVAAWSAKQKAGKSNYINESKP